MNRVEARPYREGAPVQSVRIELTDQNLRELLAPFGARLDSTHVDQLQRWGDDRVPEVLREEAWDELAVDFLSSAGITLSLVAAKELARDLLAAVAEAEATHRQPVEQWPPLQVIS